jgi:hypothetical protein
MNLPYRIFRVFLTLLARNLQRDFPLAIFTNALTIYIVFVPHLRFTKSLNTFPHSEGQEVRCEAVCWPKYVCGTVAGPRFVSGRGLHTTFLKPVV